MPSSRIAAALVLCALLLPVKSNAQDQPEQSITVTLKSYDFTPDTLSLKANTPYRLHLVNASQSGHSFSAPEFFAASRIAPTDQAKVVKGTVEVGAGQAVDLAVTPGSPGRYPLRCDHFLHAVFGMTGRIVVQ